LLPPWFHAIDFDSTTVLPLTPRRVSIGIVRDETAVFLSCAFNSRNSLQYLQFGSAQYSRANGDESVIPPPLNASRQLLLAAENTKIVQSIAYCRTFLLMLWPLREHSKSFQNCRLRNRYPPRYKLCIRLQ